MGDKKQRTIWGHAQGTEAHTKGEGNQGSAAKMQRGYKTSQDEVPYALQIVIYSTLR